MHHATVYIDPTGPTPIGFAQAAGVPGDVRFDFNTQSNIAYPNIADMYPQMILRPFTRPEYHLYDIEINDPTGSSGIASRPNFVRASATNAVRYAGQPSAGAPAVPNTCGGLRVSDHVCAWR